MFFLFFDEIKRIITYPSFTNNNNNNNERMQFEQTTGFRRFIDSTWIISAVINDHDEKLSNYSHVALF